MRSFRTSAAVLAAALGLTAAGLTVVPVPASATGTVRLTNTERRAVHDATKQFRFVDAAVDAGYVPVSDCVELPGTGGMGFHYLNPALASDDVVDPARPELLVYQRGADGRLRLGALEYFVADADQDLSTDGDRPSLFGTYPFEGPMPGHDAGMPIHYDLHIWLYDHNPAGELEAWNPSVHCSE
jgi:hypothetical protein